MFEFKIAKVLTAFIFIVFTFNLLTTIVSSADTSPAPLTQITYQSVNPGDDYKYVLKRLKEKIALFFYSFSPDRKYQYSKNLLEVRLAELKHVVDNKDIANIQTASQRYSASAGKLTEFVLAKNLSDRKVDLRNLFTSQVPVLETLRDSYEYNIGEYRFIQDDINSLASYISKL